MRNIDLDTSSKRLGFFFLVSIIGIIFCLSPYLFDFLLLPKSEDFEYTLLPAIFTNLTSLESGALTWNWQAGLGAPWPLPIGLSHSPFRWLLGTVSPFRALAIITLVHMAACYGALLFIYRWFGVRGGIAILGTTTYILAPTIETLYNSDAYTVYFTSLYLPVMFACLIGVLTTDFIFRKTIWSILLGLAVGLAILEGHVGVLPIYFIALLVFSLFMGKAAVLRAIPYGVVSIVVAALIGSDVLVFMLREQMLFSPSAPRLQNLLHNYIGGIVTGMFLWPSVGFIPPLSLDPRDFIEDWARAQSLVRNVAIGPVVLIAVAVSYRDLLTTERTRILLWSSLIVLLVMMVPLRWLPNAISASWPLRDFVNMSLCICAMYALQSPKIADLSRRRAVTMQIAIVVAGSLPLVFHSYFVSERGFFTSGQYAKLADPDVETPYIAALREGAGEGGSFPRIAASSRAWLLMDQEAGVDQGIINNVAPLHGFSEVTFIAKGVSFDSIRTSVARPYGTIVGSQIDRWALKKGEFDWITDDQPLLTLLGIRVVVTTGDEKPKASALRKYKTITTRDGFVFDFYRNETVLKRAFFLNKPSLMQEPPARCAERILVCFEVADIIAHASDIVEGIQYSGNAMSIRFPPTMGERQLIVTYMNRNNLVATDNEGRRLATIAWGGLTSVTVPEGVSGISVSYE